MSEVNQIETDVLIIGASAAGLMCAIEAGKRGRKVMVLDRANKAGKKILMSGGGRCNFTNLDVSADNFISSNPHFCKSALSRFTQWDFIAMVEKHDIPFHERAHGQLFCNDSAKDILSMLLMECEQQQVKIKLNNEILDVKQNADVTYSVTTSSGHYQATSLVIASGGLSIPKMCATPFGYKIAEQFGINIIPTRPGLVPFTLHEKDKTSYAPLSGIAVDSVVSNDRARFRENILFTHRGVSGPAILQISSYWHAGEAVSINLLPDIDLAEALKQARKTSSQQQLKTVLSHHLPKRVVDAFVNEQILNAVLQSLSDKQFEEVAQHLQNWQLKPNGTEGYRTAEVTVGGVDCDAISSKTFEVKDTNGLYFIGEVLDVTGWLGGYNFQWAWSSGWCAGQYV